MRSRYPQLNIREMPEGIRKKFKLVYLKEIPFVDLVEKKPVVDQLFMNKQNNYDSICTLFIFASYVIISFFSVFCLF